MACMTLVWIQVNGKSEVMETPGPYWSKCSYDWSGTGTSWAKKNHSKCALLKRVESLSDKQIYQVLEYIDFLNSK